MSDNTHEFEWNVGQDDPFDHYPWAWQPYSEDLKMAGYGFISTPNGRRPDGEMHTYWLMTGEVREPYGRLICALVNSWAHRRFGTPMHPDDAGTAINGLDLGPWRNEGELGL